MLRTALTLSMVTGTPFRMTEIRGGRQKPGLMRQHLTCVQAAAGVCGGATDGAELKSTEVIFHPGEVKAGDYHFRIGTAGSTMLLAQTLLPALWGAKGDSSLLLEGGTHNPMAPPADYLFEVYLPMLKRMGIKIEGELLRYGFVPAGGGKVRFKIKGGQSGKSVSILERGELKERKIHCLGAFLPDPVLGKEAGSLRKSLDWSEECVRLQETANADCAGNVVAAAVDFEQVSERVSVFGAYGKSSERVAKEAAKQMKDYLGSGAVVGRHLADQLLPSMSLAGAGEFVTGPLSNHFKTNLAVIQKFLAVGAEVSGLSKGASRIVIKTC